MILTLYFLFFVKEVYLCFEKYSNYSDKLLVKNIIKVKFQIIINVKIIVFVFF